MLKGFNPLSSQLRFLLPLLMLFFLTFAWLTPVFAADCGSALFGWTMADGRHVGGTLQNEGGWVNNPRDTGKETYKGIARKFNPKWAGWAIIDAEKAELGKQPRFGIKAYRSYAKRLNTFLAANATLQKLVVARYHANEWAEILGDDWEGMYLPYKAFDVGVNCGEGSAALCLIDTVNDLNGDASDFKRETKVTLALVTWINAYTKDDILPLDFKPRYPGDPGKPGGKDSTRRKLFITKFKEKVELHYGKVILHDPKKLAWKWVWDRRLYEDE